jgi:hypothetical protein
MIASPILTLHRSGIELNAAFSFRLAGRERHGTACHPACMADAGGVLSLLQRYRLPRIAFRKMPRVVFLFLNCLQFNFTKFNIHSMH